MQKVLITGCSGYIGQHLAKWMSDKYEVYGLDIVEPADPSPFKKIILIDIRCPFEDFLFDMDEVPLEYDTVIHLAALVQVNESMANPSDYYDTNLNGTLNLLDAIKFKNFVFASTGAAQNPISPYAVSKIAAEHCVREYCYKNQIKYTVFRFYNVIGTGGYPPTNPDGLFYNLLKSKETGEFKIFGNDYNTKDGTPVRDYIHVLEVCHALELATRKPAYVPGAEFVSLLENLGHGKGHTVLEIFTAFCKVNNLDIKLEYVPRRWGDAEKTVLDNPSPYMLQLYTLEDYVRI